MSFEKKVKDLIDKKHDENLDNLHEELKIEKINISLLKYLWSASSFSRQKETSYYDFFKKVPALNSLSDNEIRIFTKFLHRRDFVEDELIFKQGDPGYGFYFVFQGSVELCVQYGDGSKELKEHVATIERYRFFGEMGLLEETNRRSVSAYAHQDTVLLGLFKPDLDRMIELYPVTGAKFLKETALMMAMKIKLLSKEIIDLQKNLTTK